MSCYVMLCYIAVSNATAMNHTRSDFMGEFVRLVKRSGARVSLLPEIAILPAFEKVHVESKEEIRAAKIARIIATPDLTRPS